LNNPRVKGIHKTLSFDLARRGNLVNDSDKLSKNLTKTLIKFDTLVNNERKMKPNLAEKSRRLKSMQLQRNGRYTSASDHASLYSIK